MKRLGVLLIMVLLLATFSFANQLPRHSGHSWNFEQYQGPLFGVRSAFLHNLSGVSADAKALVAGLAIGDTSLLSQSVDDSMKAVSLTHLTAVSGANCAIVIGLIFLLLGRFAISRMLRASIAAFCLVLYVLLVGPQPSVLRAGVMTMVLLLAKSIGRPSSANSALALCIIVLLISDPWLATNYGFQLSVLATFGILQLAPAISARMASKLPNWLALTLAVSISAQLLCMPVLLQLQPGLSTYSVLANVIAEPLVAPVTVLGMAACLAGPLLPWLATALTWVASLGTWLIVWLATWLANAPTATISWVDGWLGISLAVIFAMAVFGWFRFTNARLRTLSILTVGLIVAATLGSCTSQTLRSGSWPSKNWEIVSCDVGQGDATVIRSKQQVALIDVGRKPAPIRSCLQRLGVVKIDLLVLTHFDLDHVGGLDGALAVSQVETSIITSFKDDRPAAAITYRKLRRASKSLIQAGQGLSGVLGDFEWKVLSPHLGAAEAEDSNDGSVTMLFQSPRVDLLALADLGEKGQMRLARESAGWLGDGFGGVPLVVKVSHHGSADQYPELYEALQPQIALVSVGANNDYGHPTSRTLNLLNRLRAKTYRTDLLGSVAIDLAPEGLRVYASGHG
jgi:competence protein ComEC